MTTWKSVHQRNPILMFALRLAIIYGLLMVPWRGLTEDYVNTVQDVIRAIYGADDARHNITVENLTDDPDHLYRSRIVIVNQALMNPDGSGPIRNVDFDTRLMNPGNLFLALVLSTPVSWRRRGWTLLMGLPISFMLGLLFLGFCIWDESSEIGLLTLDPATKKVIEIARDILTSELGLSVPILLWVLLTFRREDFRISPQFAKKMVPA